MTDKVRWVGIGFRVEQRARDPRFPAITEPIWARTDLLGLASGWFPGWDIGGIERFVNSDLLEPPPAGFDLRGCYVIYREAAEGETPGGVRSEGALLVDLIGGLTRVDVASFSWTDKPRGASD